MSETTEALEQVSHGPQARVLEGVRPDTGEIVPPPAVERVAVSERFRGASTQPVSDEQARVLMAPCDVADLDILPTGEIYLPQIFYRRLLNQVFRPGGWALVPLDKPAMVGSTLIQPWALYIHGAFVSSTYGEAEYSAKNARMSYATAAESLKSNSLMRLSKDLGIASECWDRRFAEHFKREHCEKVDGKWRRKDPAAAKAPNGAEAKPAGKPEPKPAGKPLQDSEINFGGGR